MKENAYFTVEAALVFPVVMGVIIFIIYMLLFQYDRCLLEQDVGAVMLWGCRLDSGDDTEALRERIHSRLSNIYRNKYSAWEITIMNVSLKRNRLSVQGGGRLTLISNSGAWEAEVAYECARLSPVTFIRQCRKVTNLLQKEQNEED